MPEARNQRFILTVKTHSFKDLSEHLKGHFGDKYPIKTNEMAECPPNNPRFALMWDCRYEMDNTKSKEILGIKYYDIKNTMVDMAESLIANGTIPDLRGDAKQ